MRASCCLWLMLVVIIFVFYDVNVHARHARAPLQRLRYPGAGYVRRNSAGCKIGRAKSYEHRDADGESVMADWKLTRKNMPGRDIQDETKVQDAAEDSVGSSVYQENKEFQVKPRNRWKMMYAPRNDSIKSH